MSRTLKLADPVAEERPGGSIALRYVARAGLIPELSEQTYDAFWKALREAILNSIDAGANRVDVYLSGANGDSDIVVVDDGSGMDLAALSEHFLSVGGSARFGDSSKFGRIGIGSLALLQYGQTVTVETKKAGTSTICVAELRHGDWMRETARRDLLADVPAGVAQELPYSGRPEDHFTRIRVQEPKSVAREAGLDPTAQSDLTERLRRILPLPWPDNRLTQALAATAPDVAETLSIHAGKQCARVFLHSAWDDGVPLIRRHYGERAGVGEDWTGPIHPIYKQLRVTPEKGPSRKIIIAGYILSQTHASASWSGLTARVQNVAVEEGTFFDVVADPGFRKYITGEVHFFGDVDRERLINIDRASFNRECRDYLAAQRFVADVLQVFKVRHVQRPQRLKVSARRLLQEHAQRTEAIERVTDLAPAFGEVDAPGLPASGKYFDSFVERALEDQLAGLGCRVEATEEDRFDVAVADDGAVVAHMPNEWSSQFVEAGGRRYRIRFGEASPDDLPVVIRNRPREVCFNEAHPALRGKSPEAMARALALEVAYLQSRDGGPDDLFERLLALLAAV